jgi:lipid-A-disaccharide synthase
VLALFPGSRSQEIVRHLDPFIAAARLLESRIPGLQVVLSATAHAGIDAVSCPYPVITSESFTVLRAADAALCKSGTTTLEAAVAACPLVVGYRTSAITYAAARRLVRIPDIALVNVVAGKRIVPELVQDALQPGELARLLEPLLRDSGERARMLADLSRVRESLGSAGAAERVAAIALELAGAE